MKRREREKKEERRQMDKESCRSGAKSRTKRSCSLNGSYIGLEAGKRDVKLIT